MHQHTRNIIKIVKCIYICVFFVLSVAGLFGGGGNEKQRSKPLLPAEQPLITELHTADQSDHVFNGKLYISPSHNLDNTIQYDMIGSQFDMKDYHVFSISDFDAPVTDHSEILM